MFTSSHLYTDWKAAEPDETIRENVTWADIITTMHVYYKPTEIPTLKNFHFCALTQANNETSPAFCNGVEQEAKHCQFHCTHSDCTAEQTAVRDQIIIGTSSKEIRDEALLQSLDLATLRKEGMKLESAARGGAEISGEAAINKLGRYSYGISRRKNTGPQIQRTRTRGKQDHDRKKVLTQEKENRWTLTCYYCGLKFSTSIAEHCEQCPAQDNKCSQCSKTGHFAKVCQSSKVVQQVEFDTEEPTDDSDTAEEDLYNINIFCTKSTNKSPPPKLLSRAPKKNDFKVQVIVNNSLDSVIADTGAQVSVCGTSQAQKCNLLDKMVPSSIKIKPYKSKPIPVYGIAHCAVTFGETSIPVEWHIIAGSCELFSLS